MEEAEALLRGWTDRAAAKKVLEIVASLAKSSIEKDRRLEDIRPRSLLQYEQKSTQTVQELNEEDSSIEQVQLPVPIVKKVKILHILFISVCIVWVMIYE